VEAIALESNGTLILKRAGKENPLASAKTPERIAPGVYRVSAVGLPNMISVLLLESEDGWTLVDTGMASSVGRIRDAITTLGSGPEDLKRIFLTHQHDDHVGGLRGLLEWAPEAEIGASKHEAEVVSGRREMDPFSHPIPRFLARNARAPGILVGKVLREGDLVSGFRIISTPGHTLGHTSLLRDTDGFLFTGDAFGKLLGLRVGGIKALCTDPPLAKRSARKLLKEDFGTVVMTHGKPLFTDARERLEEAVARADYE
jgi:glyoxylase-like metal-dependent hydrolase (beta-lactamase superfamily II)